MYNTSSSSIQQLKLNSFRDTLTPDTNPILHYSKAETLTLSEREIWVLREMIDYAQLHKTYVDVNFNPRLDSCFPPQGYVSIVDMNAKFKNIYDRNLFRGITVAKLSKNINKYQFSKLCAVINAIIPDKSPIPATRENGDRWVCSLGANAWMGLYESPNATNTNKYAVVVSGLDDQCYESMQLEMKMLHRMTTVGDAFKKLDFWRKIAKMNRNRIAAMLMYYVGEQVTLNDSCTFESRDIVVNNLNGDDTHAKMAREWIGDNVLVPSWYRVPNRTPNSCKPIPEELVGFPLGAVDSHVIRRPQQVQVICDITTDDVCFHQDTYMLRISGYTSLDSNHFVYLRGPCNEITLVEKISEFDLKCADSFNCIPTEAKCTPSTESQPVMECLTLTWEDGLQSIMTKSVPVDLPVHPVLSKERISDLVPVFVRVSMENGMGVVDHTFDPAKRISGFYVDDYEFITR